MLKHRTFVGRTWVLAVQKHREEIRKGSVDQERFSENENGEAQEGEIAQDIEQIQ